VGSGGGGGVGCGIRAVLVVGGVAGGVVGSGWGLIGQGDGEDVFETGEEGGCGVGYARCVGWASGVSKDEMELGGEGIRDSGIAGRNMW
jgi:hypothetical protein